MKNALFLILILTSAYAFGAGAAHGHEGIPWDKIGWQVANLGVLLAIIFYNVKKPLVDGFANRQKTYLEQFEKTKSALKDAETSLAGIKEKLSVLESGEKKSLEGAQHEANLLKANIIKDAEAASEKMKKDALLVINNELSRAKAEINEAILGQAVSVASKKITDKNQSGSAAQEAQFLKQLEQVRA